VLEELEAIYSESGIKFDLKQDFITNLAIVQALETQLVQENQLIH